MLLCQAGVGASIEQHFDGTSITEASRSMQRRYLKAGPSVQFGGSLIGRQSTVDQA